jgi:hypothetical protein
MEILRFGVKPDVYIRLVCARASLNDVVSIAEAAKSGPAKVEFYPIPNEPAWTGEGLPPVGTVCEFMKHNSPPAPEGQWTVGDIRYVSDCTVIIGGENCEHVHHPRNCSFRPVRTAEQIEREERDKACRQICVDAGGAVTESEMKIAGRLYDAGYRKQVTP